jgi:hypothetical protein
LTAPPDFPVFVPDAWERFRPPPGEGISEACQIVLRSPVCCCLERLRPSVVADSDGVPFAFTCPVRTQSLSPGDLQALSCLAI